MSSIQIHSHHVCLQTFLIVCTYYSHAWHTLLWHCRTISSAYNIILCHIITLYIRSGLYTPCLLYQYSLVCNFFDVHIHGCQNKVIWHVWYCFDHKCNWLWFHLSTCTLRLSIYRNNSIHLACQVGTFKRAPRFMGVGEQIYGTPTSEVSHAMWFEGIVDS